MVTRNYLSSTKIDYYQYMIVKSWFNYAKASVKSKQEERFATAIEAYKELVDTYPKSQYLREAEEYNTQAENYIKKIRDEHK